MNIESLLRGISREDKLGLIKSLIKDPDFKSMLKPCFEEFLATSELAVLKRIRALEKALGFVEPDDGDEVTLLDRVSRIEGVISAKQESEFQTVTEKRAEFLMKCPPQAEIAPTKEKVVRSKSFRYWLKNTLPEELRPKTWQNIRKLKRDIFEKVEKLSHGAFSIYQSPHGTKELQLFFKNVT